MIHRFIMFSLLLTTPTVLYAQDNSSDLGVHAADLPHANTGTGNDASSAETAISTIADLVEAKKAQAELDAMIRAYESGNVGYFQSRLDPALIGYQRFVDGVIRDSNQLKQLRIHLFGTQVLAGPDVAVIQTAWEKRFLSVVGFQSGLFSGHATILLHRDQNQWKITAFAGDNLFASQSGVLAQLTATPMVIAAPTNGCPVVTCPKISITVLDPDLAGQSTAVAEVISSQGDREMVTLVSTSPGRFTTTISTLIDNATPIFNASGVVDINSNPAFLPVTITIRYLDRNPGSNRPPSYLSQILRVTP